MQDPVCGMQVSREAAAGTAEWQGQSYAFCSAPCRVKFLADPALYLTEKPAVEAPDNRPSSCPLCGMGVKEENTRHLLYCHHEVLCFCSKQCKETYTQRSGMNKPADKKGRIARFLERLAKGNEQSYGGKPPKCH